MAGSNLIFCISTCFCVACADDVTDMTLQDSKTHGLQLAHILIFHNPKHEIQTDREYVACPLSSDTKVHRNHMGLQSKFHHRCHPHHLTKHDLTCILPGVCSIIDGVPLWLSQKVERNNLHPSGSWLAPQADESVCSKQSSKTSSVTHAKAHHIQHPKWTTLECLCV